jgi:DNA-binding MarR family transcriptional regulator
MSQRTPSDRRTKSVRRPADTADALFDLLGAVVSGAPRDLGLTSVGTLRTLELTGPRRVTDLAIIQGVAQPSMTVLVNALERSGFVERLRDPGDKRATLVAMTPAGAEYLRQRRKANRQVIAQLISNLPADEAATLGAAIPALRHLRDLYNQERDPAARVLPLH